MGAMALLPRLVALPLSAALLVLAGCGDDAGSGSGPGAAGDGSSGSSGSASASSPAPTSTAPAGPPARLDLRVVEASSEVGAPDSQVQADFEALRCSRPPHDVPAGRPLTTCDDEGGKYALGPAGVSTRVVTAIVLPAAHSAWAVDVTLDDAASDDLATLSGRLARTRQAAAMVVDDLVVTTLVFASRVTDGRLQIAGTFTEDEADQIADALLGQ